MSSLGDGIDLVANAGLKQSGYRKDLSTYALEDYTAVRHIMVAHHGG